MKPVSCPTVLLSPARPCSAPWPCPLIRGETTNSKLAPLRILPECSAQQLGFHIPPSLSLPCVPVSSYFSFKRLVLLPASVSALQGQGRV